MKDRLYEFAKFVSNHEGYQDIVKEIQQECFMKFITASDEERTEISNIMKGLMIYNNKLTQIINSHINSDINN